MGRIGYEGATIRMNKGNSWSACLRSASEITAAGSCLPPTARLNFGDRIDPVDALLYCGPINHEHSRHRSANG